MKYYLPLFLLAASLTACFISCKKDVPITNTKVIDAPTIDDSIVKDHAIVVGNDTNIDLSKFDITLSGQYNSPIFYNIDIDKDGEDDYCLVSVISGSPGMGMMPESILRCINKDAYILENYVPDTTFFHVEHDTSIVNGNPFYTTTKVYSCRRITVKDSICGTGTARPIQKLEKGDSLDTKGNWFVDSVYLFETGPTLHLDKPTDPLSQFILDCHNKNGNIPFYIGIKKIVNGFPKLGWIKLATSDQVIRIRETALEK